MPFVCIFHSLIIPNINDNTKYVSKLNKKIRDRLSKYERVHINSTDASIPNVINFSLRGIKPETFVHALDENEIYISDIAINVTSIPQSKDGYVYPEISFYKQRK